MADNPLPPLRPNASIDEIRSWIIYEAFPRITQQSAIIWEQVDKDGGSLEDLDSGDFITVDYFTTTVATTTTAGTVKQAGAVTDLGLTAVTPSAGYVQAQAKSVADQVKDVADKVDALMAALRTSGVLES